MDNSAEIVASLASVNSGRTQNDVRQKEHGRLTAFMDSPLFVLLPLAKMLLSTNTLPTSTRLYGSQCLSHYVRTRLAQSPQLRDDISGIAGVVLPALASQDLSLVSMPGNRPLVNHLSTVIADAAAIAWPTAWPSFFSDLAYLSTASITGALTAALVIPRLVEAATTPIPHVPTRVRVALASALTSAIQHEELAHQYVALSSACLSAVGQNVDALAASLPKESTPTPQLFACFNNASPILVTDLLKASVDAITALCGRATPNYLVDAGVWHVLRALFNCPAAAAGAVDAAKVAADAAARGAGTTYGREMLSLWRLVLELLNNASVSREGLGRSAQASILTQALAALKGLVKDHASRTLSPTGNATGDKEKEEVASQTVACVLSLASFPVAKVADEAAAVAAAIAGSLPAFVGGGREAATLCVQSFAALALRLLQRIPLSTGDGDDDDDDDDDTYETPEERRNTRMKTNRSHSSVIVRNLALAAPVGLLTAAYALIRDAVLAYQPFDAAPAAGKAVRWPSQGKEPTYSEEFNIAFQPFKANTTACDCDAFFAFEASSRLLSDIMTTLTSSKGLFAPTPAPSPAILAAAIAAANASAPPSAAAAAAATASAADSAAAAHRSALVQEITHPRGPLAPRSALAGEAIETLRLLYEATRQLVCYEVCAWLPKVKILTLSLPVFAAGVVAPVGLVEALMPVFLVSKRGNGSVTSPITEAQRLIAASLEAFLKRVEAPGLGADPEAVADGLGECIKAVAFGMSGDAAGQYVDPWLAATSSLRLTTGGAATDAAAAAWPTVSALETARLTILVRFGSPEVQKQVIESRVVPALSAWVSVPSNPAAATSATDAVAAGAGLLLLPALDVLGGSPHEAAATTAEISAWATCAAAAANAAAAQGAWGGAGKSLEELGVDLNSLPYAAKGAMQEARQRADRGLSGLAMALRVLCVPDPSFAAAAAEKAAAAQAAAQTAKAACERANAAVAVALSAATAASPRGPGMGGRKMVAETTPAAAAAAAEAAIAAAAAAAAEAAASGRGEFDSGKGFSTGALSGPAGGSDMPLNGIIPSVYSYVLTDCIRVLAWMLEATAPGSMGSRPSYLAVLAAPTPAHATWLLQFDALATVGTSLAAPVDRHTPLRTWSWTQRCLQSLYQILAGLHLAGNGIYAANLRCLDPIEPMFPQMSPEVISDFWLKTMIPIIHGCPKELYGPFFGTVLSSALGALARITSAAGAAAAAVASGAEIDYTSLGGFAGALARARGGGLRPPGSGAAGTGVPVGWGAIGESETDLKDALETMEAEGVTASVAKVLESILKLLLGASNSQKVYDAAVLAKVKSFNAAVYAAAPGQTISPEQAWAATAAAAPVFSPAMAAFVPTCSQSLTELIKAALTLPSAAVAQKAVALARLLSASAPALPQPHGAELADAMAEVAVVAGKRWVQRERDTFVKRVGNNLVKTNSVEDFFADDVAAMFRDLIVMHHGVGSMGVQALLQVPGMTPEVVEELTAMASNGFAVPPVEGQRGRKIERAMAPVGSGPGALEPENSRKFIVKYLKHIFTADLKRQ